MSLITCGIPVRVPSIEGGLTVTGGSQGYSLSHVGWKSVTSGGGAATGSQGYSLSHVNRGIGVFSSGGGSTATKSGGVSTTGSTGASSTSGGEGIAVTSVGGGKSAGSGTGARSRIRRVWHELHFLASEVWRSSHAVMTVVRKVTRAMSVERQDVGDDASQVFLRALKIGVAFNLQDALDLYTCEGM